jgi:uncharacterized protein YfaQ (DUF2300 family)
MTNTSTPTVTSTGTLTPQVTATFTPTFTKTVTSTFTATITATPVATNQMVLSGATVVVTAVLDNVTVQIPPGIFSAGTTFTVSEGASSSVPPPHSFQTVLGNVYTFDASNSGGSQNSFSGSVTLIFSVSASTLAKYTDQQLQVQYYNTTNQAWTPVATTIDRVNDRLLVVTNHFSTWAVFAQNYLSSSQSGGGNILAPVPANSGDSICLYSAQNVAASTWSVYSVAGYHVATVSYSNSEGSQCWNTQGVGRGLYYVKLQLTFVGGTSVTEWHKVVVK